MPGLSAEPDLGMVAQHSLNEWEANYLFDQQPALRPGSGRRFPDRRGISTMFVGVADQSAAVCGACALTGSNPLPPAGGLGTAKWNWLPPRRHQEEVRGDIGSLSGPGTIRAFRDCASSDCLPRGVRLDPSMHPIPVLIHLSFDLKLHRLASCRARWFSASVQKPEIGSVPNTQITSSDAGYCVGDVAGERRGVPRKPGSRA